MLGFFSRRSSLLSPVSNMRTESSKEKRSLEIYVSYKALSASGHHHRQRVSQSSPLALLWCLHNKINGRVRFSIHIRTHSFQTEWKYFCVWNTGTERVPIEVHTLFASARHFFPGSILFYHCLNNVANVNRRPHVGRKLKPERRGGQRSQIK